MQSAEAQNWGYRTTAAVVRSRSRRPARAQAGAAVAGVGPALGKTLGNLEDGLLPAKVRGNYPRSWKAASSNGPRTCWCSGCWRGKTHFLCALGRELVLRHACTVYFTPTFKLVQQLLAAKRELGLDKLLKKLDRFEAVILDDLGYVQQSREEMEVLFTFLAERYERRSVLVSSNLVFSKWDQIFKDPMTTMAAVDRLVHHAIILEFDGESMRVPRQKEKGGG